MNDYWNDPPEVDEGPLCPKCDGYSDLERETKTHLHMKCDECDHQWSVELEQDDGAWIEAMHGDESSTNEKEHEMSTNETKHTPGPWTIQIDTGMNDGGTVIDADARGVAMDIYGADPESAAANARLIAAAPEMLGALEGLSAYADARPQIDERCQAPLFAVIKSARAAIEKAKGPTQ